MSIEQIKSEIIRRPYLYEMEMSLALNKVIDFLQDASKHYNVQEGQRAIAALKVIENCFPEE